MRGKFITLEGIEGSGKSTQLEILAEHLQHKDIPCLVTREPGGTELAEQIRSILLTDHEEAMHHDTELLLMFAARAQHVHTKILPALERGMWVLCDRFIDATFAYQGFGRRIPLQRIHELEKWVLPEFSVDLTLLFELTVASANERVALRGAKDRFEKENVQFFEKIRQGYLQLAHEFPDRIRCIDASGTIEQVSAQMIKTIDQFIVEPSR